MHDKISCSVEILTRNSAATLRRALESVRDFAEILVIDGGSTDNTRAIAQEFGAKILPQDTAFLYSDGRISDFASVRNQGLNAATQPWFFFLDSDEYLSNELVSAIRQATAGESPAAYRVSRLYVVKGLVIKRASTYPNMSLRFFKRSPDRHFIKKVHERIDIEPAMPIGVLKGPLYVPFDTDIERLRSKWDYYIGIEVKRHRQVTLAVLVRVGWSSFKASVLYALRFIRDVFKSGPHMPSLVELERHRYHLRLMRALIQARICR